MVSSHTKGRKELPNIFCHIDSHPSRKPEVPTTMIQKGTDHLEPLIYWVEEVAGEKPLGRCKNVFDIIQARYDDKIWSRAFLRVGKSSDDYPIIYFVKETKDKASDTKREQVVKLKRGDNAEKVLDKILVLCIRKDLGLTDTLCFYFGETHRKICIYVTKFLQ